jgi:hypothetical protein
MWKYIPTLCVGCYKQSLLKYTFCRNLRIREDTAKYLLNLDVNSAHYDPKTRSMREDPLPDADPNEKFYGVSALED